MVTYYPIDETLARRAKEMNSFYDYKPGSATASYRQEVDKAAAIAEAQKARVDPMYHEKIDRLLDAYARRLAENLNKSHEIAARCPSILIAGPANFPVRKKEKQNRADAAKDFDSFRVENDKRLTSGDDFTYLPERNSYKFPDKLLAVLKENENGYPVNRLGETYGSALLVGYNDNYTMPPVLLSAVGSNGVHGYVREADLSPYLATRKDAVAYMSKLERNRILPLYDRDGNVIGTFVLDGSFTSGTTAKELESAQAAAAAKPGAQTSQSVKLPTAKVELAKLAKRSQDNCPYQRNSKGETYGSSAAVGSVGYAPVWVTVVSTDGDQGVVRSKDFFLAKPGVLPVYNLEGKVIGEFLIEEFVPPAGYKPGMSMEELKTLVKDG